MFTSYKCGDQCLQGPLKLVTFVLCSGFTMRFNGTGKETNVPTLVIVGDEDGSTPINVVKDGANLIDGSIFKIIKKAGHLPCESNRMKKVDFSSFR